MRCRNDRGRRIELGRVECTFLRLSQAGPADDEDTSSSRVTVSVVPHWRRAVPRAPVGVNWPVDGSNTSAESVGVPPQVGEPPATSTFPSGSKVPHAPRRCADIVPATVVQVPVLGSQTSADAVSQGAAPLDVVPPAISTLPSCKRTATAALRVHAIDPVAAKVRVLGSYTCAAGPPQPPATSTRPSWRTVMVPVAESVTGEPVVAANVVVLGSNTSAVSAPEQHPNPTTT